MAYQLGYSDLKQVILTPATWDLTYLKKFSLRDGVTLDRVLARFGTALSLFNRSLTQGYWSQYVSTTTMIEKEYENGGDGSTLDRYSEFERPDPIIGTLTGHMIPMNDYGGALGWSYLALRRARMANLDVNVQALINRSRNRWSQEIVKRLFLSTVDTVGTTGKSLPFADGGAGDATYVPGAYEGKTFDTTHNHFLRNTDDAAGRSAAIDGMINHLIEHGFTAPFDLLIPDDATEIGLWTAQAEFKKPERGVLSTAGVEVRALVPDESYIGIVEGDRGWARVKPVPRIPVNYCGMFKPTGFNNPAAPLVVRYEEGYPLGLSLVAKETAFPFTDAIALMTFGVGVGNRTAGVCNYFAASGNYVDPTIS